MDNLINCLFYLESELLINRKSSQPTMDNKNDDNVSLEVAKSEYKGRWSSAVMLILKLYAMMEVESDYDFSYSDFSTNYNINAKNLRSVIALCEQVGLVSLITKKIKFGDKQKNKTFICLKRLPKSRRNVSSMASNRIIELLDDACIKEQNLRGISKSKQDEVLQSRAQWVLPKKRHDLNHDGYLFLIALLYFSDDCLVTLNTSYNLIEEIFGVTIGYSKKIVNTLLELGYLYGYLSGAGASNSFGLNRLTSSYYLDPYSKFHCGNDVVVLEEIESSVKKRLVDIFSIAVICHAEVNKRLKVEENLLLRHVKFAGKKNISDDELENFRESKRLDFIESWFNSFLPMRGWTAANKCYYFVKDEVLSSIYNLGECFKGMKDFFALNQRAFHHQALISYVTSFLLSDKEVLCRADTLREAEFSIKPEHNDKKTDLLKTEDRIAQRQLHEGLFCSLFDLVLECIEKFSVSRVSKSFVRFKQADLQHCYNKIVAFFVTVQLLEIVQSEQWETKLFDKRWYSIRPILLDGNIERYMINDLRSKSQGFDNLQIIFCQSELPQ